MGEPSDAERVSVPAREELLSSWKEIAAYFGRDVTTVQRWEKREGMPVRRHVHDKIGSVYALRLELESWAASRNPNSAAQPAGSAPSSQEPPLAPQEPPLAPQEPPLAPQEPHLASQEPRQPSQESPLLVSHGQPLAEPVAQAHPGKRLFLAPGTVSVAVAGVILAIAAALVFTGRNRSARNPLEGVRFQAITDFEGVARDAALSRDGKFVAFLSDHDGQMDVWVTQVGSGEFHNLTRGSMAELVNPQVRTLGFSPDGSLVTFWLRSAGDSKGAISIWAVPTLGGQPRPYLEGVAEFDWSRDGSRLVYHTPGPGDPLFVISGFKRSEAPSIFTAPAGLHCHFPVWSHDGKFIYFVEGALPDKLDIWRIAAKGGSAEQITFHHAYVSHPVLLDDRTLLYLARDREGAGPWIYSTDLMWHTTRRLTAGPERYRSIAASADGGQIVATLSRPKTSLWRMPITQPPNETGSPVPVRLTTSAGFFPRYGKSYLLYVSSFGEGNGIWKYADGVGTELWNASDAQVLAAPVVSADGQSIAFPVRQNGQSRLYVMQADGTHVHAVTGSLDLQGEPAWAPDGRSLLSAVNERGTPHLFRIPVNGGAPISFVGSYSVDPLSLPDQRMVVYSGPDVGTSYTIMAANFDGSPHAMAALTLTRGSRHMAALHGSDCLVLLEGEMEHKDLWCLDLRTGLKRQLTRLPGDFGVKDFDVSADGNEVVLERLQEPSDIVLLRRK